MCSRCLRIVIAVAVCFSLVSTLAACSSRQNDAAEQNKTISEIYLYGNMDAMKRKSDVRSVAAFFVQGDKEISCHATIKVQGTSSLVYEKKNYTIQFFQDPAHETGMAVDVGWGAENTYCLKANWIDKTHSRNIVTAKLAAEIQRKYNVLEQAPCNGLVDGFPVEVYINGQFHGLYTWNIPKSEWQFGMDQENPDHILMCGEDWKPAAVFYDTPNLNSWSIEAGPENEETLGKFSRLSEFIMNSSDEEFKTEFESYIDLDAALNYYILVDFAYLKDNRGKNMLVATYDGNVWYPSLYDLDTSWGTHWRGTKLYDYANEQLSFSEVNNLARRMELVFSNELHDRYFELRQELLTKDHILDLFVTFDNQISDEAKACEVERWGEQIPGYDFSQVEEYLDTIIPQLDKKYSDFKT